jgi:hypothetical protein
MVYAQPAMTAAAIGLTSWRQNRGHASVAVPTREEVGMRTMIVGALCAIAMIANVNAAIKEEPVTYKDGETTMKGFVVYDDANTTKRPGIVMVHEWWGITQHMHNEARKFAERGYTAFIADMYGDAKTADNRRTPARCRAR